MSRSDAILVGENWISEHYFTTDATKESFRAKVLERRAFWDEEAKANRPTPRSRFVEARQSLEAELSTLAELLDPTGGTDRRDARDPDQVAAGLHERLLEVLELTGHGLALDRQEALLRVSSPGITDRAPLVVVSARPVIAVEDLIKRDEPTLREPVQLTEDADELKSVAKLVSALFVADHGPDLVLVLAGRWALLAERERWAEGRYLAVDLQLVCERNDTKKGGEIDRALTCLSAQSIAPDADGKLWWHGVLGASVKHTVGVSKDLREGVRLSIEIVANEVVTRRRDKGHPPLPASEAQPLARQSLRFLYRILFLLYAEASPELGVLPVGAREYDQGYGLDRLRELVQVELATPHARNGTHLYDSLALLFRLVDRGHSPEGGVEDEDEATTTQGLTFNPLRADLFLPEATAHINEVKLGNVALQRVLTHLLLSKESRGKDRGFISYAELGINQLGAVYEGLMSYTGFFAETDLYEVAKNGDASKGSWVVPVDRADGIASADFVKAPDPTTGEEKPVVHRQGSFVFRLAGRERQQSASYYTPEVLTKFTVGQALEELLDQDGRTTTADEILSLTVCEPALGSGAFAIEAVRQLAEQYLKRRQDELDCRIDPDDYPRRLQEVKAYLALHNVYGVDLNATAVEFAEITLWLDTMAKGLAAPWFGLHLRRGNSLVGARRAVYRRSQIADKSWLKAVPQEVPLTSLVEDIDAGRVASDGIHHFLLPADGWGAAADAKEAAALAPEAAKRLKDWRRGVKAKPNKQQTDALVELAHRVEVLWQIAYRRLRIAEQEIRRAIPVWGAEDLPVGGRVQREQIEAALADADGAYQRLRRVMDAWTALWFWPLTDEPTTVDGVRVEPPTLTQWIAGLQALLGRSPELRKPSLPRDTLAAGAAWEELNQAEELELGFAHARPVAEVKKNYLWLDIVERIARKHGFLHWNLDFVTVFARGGFDLQLGNPPWVRPDWKPRLALAEHDPRWALNDEVTDTGGNELSIAEYDYLARSDYLDSHATITSLRFSLSSAAQYPLLKSLRPDLYRCFIEQSWRHRGQRGICAFIHPESHFTDENADRLRRAAYLHLRRHWQFKNELKLFDTGNKDNFGVHIYAAPNSEPCFVQAAGLYHPDTVSRSLVHDGSGEEPGLKDSNGNWDLRPHNSRIVYVTTRTLSMWKELLEEEGEALAARMIYTVNRSTSSVLENMTSLERVASVGLRYSLGWDETAEEKRGRIAKRWGNRNTWSEVIVQGPALSIATPMAKMPNSTMRSNRDWCQTDLETLSDGFVPPSNYARAVAREEFEKGYASWKLDGTTVPTSGFFRIAWRSMARPANERTLIPAIIPPGPTHLTQSVYSAGLPRGSQHMLVEVAGWMSSLLADLVIRSAPKSSIPRSVVDSLPFAPTDPFSAELRFRTLRMNAITAAYFPLWSEVFEDSFMLCSWTGGIEYPGRPSLSGVHREWSHHSPLRVASDRRQALLEMDVLVAMMASITADELCTIYRTQFPVLYGYDRNRDHYDANGRLVPHEVLKVWRKTGDRITEEERTATNQAGNTYTYELPFVTLDREADMRQAYAHFERLLAERS